MFSVPLGSDEVLDGGRISEALRVQFEDNGIMLSQAAAVPFVDNGVKWQIADGDETFWIKNENDLLNVYSIQTHARGVMVRGNPFPITGPVTRIRMVSTTATKFTARSKVIAVCRGALFWKTAEKPTRRLRAQNDLIPMVMV